MHHLRYPWIYAAELVLSLMCFAGFFAHKVANAVVFVALILSGIVATSTVFVGEVPS